MIRYWKKYTLLSAILLCCFEVLGTPIIIFSKENIIQNIGDNIEIFEDKSTKLTINDILNNQPFFKQSTQKVPNLGVSTSAFWIRITIQNITNDNFLMLSIAQPTIEEVDFYSISPDGNMVSEKEGAFQSFHKRKIQHQDFIFELNILKGQTKTYYIKIRSSDQIVVPVVIGTPRKIMEQITQKDTLYGLFFGIFLVMFLYNFFIYFTLHDRTYLYYCLYIILVALTQGTLHGQAFRFVWPDSAWLAKNSAFLFPSITGIAALLFVSFFLQVKIYAAGLNRVLYTLVFIFLVSILLLFLNQYVISFTIMQLNTTIVCLFILYLSYVVLKRGFRPAKFFLLAWSSLLIGAIIFVLKDFGIFPYNAFTENTLIGGSAIEVTLLSFALADKINIFKKEKEKSQAETLRLSMANEQIIKNQNIILEKQVKERTTDLENALTDLKDTQVQLVESEKMASLGVLTAGVAHEINNPINFVSANIKPLTLNINDLVTLIEHYELIHTTPAEDMPKLLAEIDALKQQLDIPLVTEEIQIMLQTIKEGASRTAEIVEGLRNFSRLDESDFKNANVHEGIDSTLMLLRSTIPPQIKIIKQYNAVDGKIDCFPGQLNQVFMNIINNAIQAIKAKEQLEDESITIQTMRDEKYFHIRIADTGIGMSEEVKSKVFDPFFTTKKVGEGTGLGLSIVHKIIEKHDGKINVTSTIGKGTTFAIQLAIQPKSMHS